MYVRLQSKIKAFVASFVIDMQMLLIYSYYCFFIGRIRIRFLNFVYLLDPDPVKRYLPDPEPRQVGTMQCIKITKKLVNWTGSESVYYRRIWWIRTFTGGEKRNWVT